MAAPTEAADTAAPPPPPPATAEPQMSAPTAPADAAAPPAPTLAPEPAEKVPHAPPHMAVPSGAADIAAPPPVPPVQEPAAKVSHALPPTPLPDAPAPKKRKLEDAGFHMSAYYKIRTTIADLRLRFVQVCEATDFRNSDAAREILKEIKIVMELCKKTRIDLSAAFEPVKPSCKPLAGGVKNGPTEPIPSVERNQVPQTGQTAISPNNANEVAPPQACK